MEDLPQNSKSHEPSRSATGLWPSIKRRYKGVGAVFGRYWHIYGGARELFSSPYLHVSFCLTGISYGLWTDSGWWDKVYSVMPNLVGFSVGAFAIFLSAGGEAFQRKISGSDGHRPGNASPFLKVAASFTHFIVVQVIAIFLAVVLEAIYANPPIFEAAEFVWIMEKLRGPVWFVGFWSFLYALSLTVGTVLAIFRTATWIDAHHEKKPT